MNNGMYVKRYNQDVLEHRFMMEQHLKRKLKPLEIVHHKNEIKNDNRIENLELCSNQKEHINKFHKKETISKKLTISMPEATIKKLKEIKEKTGIPVSTYITMLVNKVIEGDKK